MPALVLVATTTALNPHRSRIIDLRINAQAPGRRSRLTAQAMTNNITEEDEKYMARALELARTAEGETYPNPIVGSVVVNNGAVVGEGFHPKAGKPHAEVYALRAAGQAAQGSTAYVTLEPCNHFGRTPPCSLALIEAGVSRVVLGVVDPNPLVGGSGVERLVNAGITVDGPCLEQECFEQNKDFMARMKAEATANA